MSIISNLAHRKQSNLTIADIPDGVTSIGDAAYSLCPYLKQVIIPASVEHIGVAAFCGTGLETVTFNGVPTDMEPSLFIACKHLRAIIVPRGKKAIFDSLLPTHAHLIREKQMMPPVAKVVEQTKTKIVPPKAKAQIIVNRSNLTYNCHAFSWTKGDCFKISDLLSDSVPMNDNISFQFRRKYLFVFMKSHIAAQIMPGKEYCIPAKTYLFKRKYEEKYGTKKVRMFLFITNDGKTAKFLDEVTYNRSTSNSIFVSSIF